MCPDAELLCAWNDGEVPAPWSERIASHVADCPSCSGKVGSWRKLSGRLRSAGGIDEAAAVSRIRARLDEGVAEPAMAGSRRGRGLSIASPRRAGPFTLPRPLAAAAALALLFTGAILGGLSGGFFAGSAAGPMAKASASDPGSTLASNLPSTSNMESLVRYLEAQNAQVSVTIQLPQNSAFTSKGEPLIVKTVPGETVSWPPGGSTGGFVMTGQGK